MEEALDRSSATLADLGEDALLASVFPSFPAFERDLVGPGDDAAVVTLAVGPLVATTDTMVRGRDWLDAWSSASDVAIKCLTQNLADVAAMGARPTSLLVTLVADPATPVAWVREFAATLGAEAAVAGVSVIGGDLSSAASGVLVVSVTALGDLEGRSAVCRSGARVGDVVAVSGSLGRSAAGLWLLSSMPVEQAQARGADLIASHVRPRTDVGAGVVAAVAGATSLIDISDGLLRDAHRVAKASEVRIDLDAAVLEQFEAVLTSAVGPGVAGECVLAGGEEHSLLATFPTGSAVPSGWRVLGRVGAGAGVTIDGAAVSPRGWDHFRVE